MSTPFRMQGEIDVNADQAKAALRDTGKTARDAAKTIGSIDKDGRKAAKGLDRTARAADTAEDELRQLEAAQRTQAGAARQVGRANKVAAGQMGNLAAQGNDVITMLAAGQNPMQLALQQGTQITQVIGPMGAAGAYQALKGAVLSMVNPISLITIGSIAAAGVMVNWFRESGEEAQTFEDRLQAINDAMEAYDTFVETAISRTEDLQDKFGRFAEDVRTFAEFGADANAAKFIEDIDGAIDELTRRFGELDGGVVLPNRGLVMETERTAEDIQREFDVTKAEATALVSAMERLDDASGVDQTVAASNELLNVLRRIRARVGELPPEFRQLGLDTINIAQQVAQQAQTEADRAEAARQREKAAIAETVQLLNEKTIASMQANAHLEAETATLNQQIDLRRAILQYGADSAEVTRLRAEHERDALLEMVATSDATEDVKAAMIEAVEAAFQLATTDTASGISAAAAEAAELAAQLGISLDLAMAIGGQTDRIKRRQQEVLTPLGANPVMPVERTGGPRETTIVNKPKRRTRRRGGGGGGGRGGAIREIERQQQAIDRLIQSEQQELDILRETDPVQQELLRHRETLASATQAEKAQIEDLIRARTEEAEAIEEAKRRNEEYRELTGLVISEGLRGWSELEDAIRQAAMQALIFGEGPLGGIFDGIFGGSGGLVGGIGDLLGFADGGLPGEARAGKQLGAGGPRADQMVVRVSPGEYIVNAAATARNRPVLDAINAGAVIPGFASGGLPGTGPVAAPSPAMAVGGRSDQPSLGVLEIVPSKLFKVVAREQSIESAQIVVRDYDANTLPGRVNEINDDPRRVG